MVVRAARGKVVSRLAFARRALAWDGLPQREAQWLSHALQSLVLCVRDGLNPPWPSSGFVGKRDIMEELND
eukprot:3719686-Prorocentrum_lima.AAC.1